MEKTSSASIFVTVLVMDMTLSKAKRESKGKKNLKEEIEAKILFDAFAPKNNIEPDKNSRVLLKMGSINEDFLLTKKRDKPLRFTHIPHQGSTLPNIAKKSFKGIVVARSSQGISRGYYNPRIQKFVGGCRPDLVRNGKLDSWRETGFYFIECCHCGVEFKTKDKRQKYHSLKCKRGEGIYQRKLRRLVNKGFRECPICHEEYIPKSKNSPTCGKGKCRTAFSRNQKKLRN